VPGGVSVWPVVRIASGSTGAGERSSAVAVSAVAS